MCKEYREYIKAKKVKINLVSVLGRHRVQKKQAKSMEISTIHPSVAKH